MVLNLYITLETATFRPSPPMDNLPNMMDGGRMAQNEMVRFAGYKSNIRDFKLPDRTTWIVINYKYLSVTV